MGTNHEETINRGPVSGGHQGAGNRTTDYRYSAWRAGRGEASSRICYEVGTIQRSGIASSKTGMGGRTKDAPRRLRASNGRATRTSSVHCEEMGSGRKEKETGTTVMKTLVTAIQKGGQGKTFATCHLAFDFQERGLRVAVIDLDTQANASFTLAGHESGYVASQLFSSDTDGLHSWFSGREHNGITLIAADPGLANLDKMELSHAATSMRNSIAALSNYFDVCLIDTAPSLGVGMTAAVLASDFMLSPLEMEAYSLQGMKKMVSVIGNLRKLNPKLRFLGMVPNKVDARKPRHIANLATLQQAYPQLVLPFSVGARDSIAEALGEQIPVWKLKKTAARKATQEVRALVDYVFTKMEIV